MWAQNETQQANGGLDEVSLEVFLMNGQKIILQVVPTLQTNDVLEVRCVLLY